MANQSYTSQYDELPFILRVIIQVFLGWLAGGIYRIVRYTETKNTTTLIVGVIGIIPGFDIVAWVADLVTLAMNKKYTLFVD